MHKFNRLAFANVWQFICDLIFLLLAFILSYIFTSVFISLKPIHDYFWVLIVYIPFWFFSMIILGMYNKTTFNYFDRIFRSVAFSTIIAGLAVAVLFYMTKNSFFSRRLYSTLIILTIILLLAERYVFLKFFKKLRKNSENKVIFIGTQELIEKSEYYLKKTQISMNIIGYLKLNENMQLDYECIGVLKNLPAILKDNIIDEVVFAVPKEFVSQIEGYILLCEEMGITVRLLLELYDLKVAKTHIDSLGTIPMITYHTVNLNNVQLLAKRALDIFGAVVGLAITAIISIFVIPAIKIDSPGPVFFKQDRIGLKGRVFKLYKFRSMSLDAEIKKQELLSQNQVKGGLMFKIKVDPRITRVGKLLRKLSIDELPQFWNVLKGDMSLVGTRPPTPDEVSKYLNGHWRRISIKPGLTGLWQVSGRSSIMDFDEVVKLDTCYIDRWSVMEDFRIILKTIPAVLAKRGAM
jgi:exopolysaccharide biosynthesis polyprenyl glycosylphosphotransferase